MEFGNYNNYEVWPYQFLGVSCALLIFGIVFAGMAYSKLYNVLMKTPEHEEKESEWVDINMAEMSNKEAADDSYVNMNDMEKPTKASESDGFVNAEVEDNDGVMT